MRDMLSQEEVDQLLPRLAAAIERVEADDPTARALPPMTVGECLERFYGLMDTAATRPLTLEECRLHGQLLSVYMQAVRAEVLGRKGRYFVMSEEDLLAAAKAHGVR